MKKRFDLDLPGHIASQDPRQQFDRSLYQPFRPTRLLTFERIHLHRKLGRTDDLWQIQKFPSRQLGAIAEVCVFSERVVLPTTAALNRGAAPDTGGSVEIEESPGKMTATMFDHEMTVQNHRFDLRQKRVLAIDMSPSNLHHSDFRIGEIVDDIFQKIWSRKKIGIKD